MSTLQQIINLLSELSYFELEVLDENIIEAMRVVAKKAKSEVKKDLQDFPHSYLGAQ